MTLNPQNILLLAGISFLFVAIVGGRIIAKGFNIPEVPIKARWVLGIAGLGLLGIFILFFSDPREPCRRPKPVPALAADARSEIEIRDFLKSENFHFVVTEPTFISGAPKGVVVGQDPEPGKVLCPRDKVTIKVTR